MIRRKEEYNVTVREAMRGGPGSIKITNLADKSEMYDKARLFSHMVVEPGCGIGYHEHNGETEIFFIEEGSLTYNDNGTEIDVYAGDVTVCPSGQGHGIMNNTDKTCKLIALIVLE